MKKYFDLATKHKHRKMVFHGEPILVRLHSHAKFIELMDKLAVMTDNKERAEVLAQQFTDPVELVPAFDVEELLSDDFPKSDLELIAELLLQANVSPDPEKKS